MYSEIFSAVKVLATSYAAPYTEIDNGSMPAENGLAMYPGPGLSKQRHFDKGGIYEIVIALNGKHQDLGILLRVLSNIHREISLRTEYPSGTDWEILNIETATPPNYLEREASGTRQWLYGSLLRVTFLAKGECL